MDLQPFKKPMGFEEQSKVVGSVSRIHGTELQEWLLHDLSGNLNNYKGYSCHDMDNGDIPGKKFFTINGNPLRSDILVTNASDVPPALIIESKGTINENIYGLLWFAERYKELGIPYIVVTKDTKDVFRTGSSSYLKYIEANGNIKFFINSHDNYDSSKEVFNWEEYSFNEYVQPYFKINEYLFNAVKEHYEKYSNKNKFFNFEK
tara:strand:- start:12 stop:626 length:615 start_codon:yes stop_codon:yes gene_type:complete